MKQTLRFAESLGVVFCEVAGVRIEIPVIPGILKHPTPEQLPLLLQTPDVAVKYTMLAIEKCGWPILRLFPRDWLRRCMPHARLRPSRREALLFLLS